MNAGRVGATPVLPRRDLAMRRGRIRIHFLLDLGLVLAPLHPLRLTFVPFTAMIAAI